MTIILATLVDHPFQMIYAKIQPQAILGFGEQVFFKFFSHTNAQGSKLDLAVKRSNVNV